MKILLAEMTREEIRSLATGALAVLPTASIEQHGPHLPVSTDTLLCEAVVHRAAQRANEKQRVVVAPSLCYGNSHHHFPFPGVLSLTSETYTTALIQILEGLARSGFRKLLVVNGHGGNTHPNGVVALDMVHRLGHPVAITVADYWDVARDAMSAGGLLPRGRYPGHAGLFETAMVLALRPDLVDSQAVKDLPDAPAREVGLDGDLPGATAQIHGAWARTSGYTDYPSSATAEMGQAYLACISQAVAGLMLACAQREP